MLERNWRTSRIDCSGRSYQPPKRAEMGFLKLRPGWLPCPQGKFAGILSRIPRDQAIYVQFYALPQGLQANSLCGAGRERAGKHAGKFSSLTGNFCGWPGFSTQRGEFLTRAFAEDIS
jgi:hypothetical protein